MKHLQPTFLLLLLLAALCSAGKCKSTPIGKTYDVVAVIVESEDAAMLAWSDDYVARETRAELLPDGEEREAAMADLKAEGIEVAKVHDSFLAAKQLAADIIEASAAEDPELVRERVRTLLNAALASVISTINRFAP